MKKATAITFEQHLIEKTKRAQAFCDFVKKIDKLFNKINKG